MNELVWGSSEYYPIMFSPLINFYALHMGKVRRGRGYSWGRALSLHRTAEGGDSDSKPDPILTRNVSTVASNFYDTNKGYCLVIRVNRANVPVPKREAIEGATPRKGTLSTPYPSPQPTPC